MFGRFTVRGSGFAVLAEGTASGFSVHGSRFGVGEEDGWGQQAGRLFNGEDGGAILDLGFGI